MTNAELAVLGLVVEEPRHGYEIEQVIEARGMRNWTEIGFSSIYYLLKKLESQGLVTGKTDTAETKGPSRRVYSATRQGRGAWKRETRRALANPRRQFPDIFLGLAGMPGLGTDETIAAFEEYLDELAQRSAEASRARERSGPDLPDHVEAMFTYSEAMIEAESSWVRDFVDVMSRRKEQV